MILHEPNFSTLGQKKKTEKGKANVQNVHIMLSTIL